MNSGEPAPPNGITYLERKNAKGNKSQKMTGWPRYRMANSCDLNRLFLDIEQ